MLHRIVRIRVLERADARAIETWRYRGREAVYDTDGATISADLGYYALDDASGELVGYCCYGEEARVPGLEDEPGVVDVGVGLRPDLLGGGWGASVTARVLHHGRSLYQASRFRVAVLAWNERSIRTVRRAGFEERCRHEMLRLGVSPGRSRDSSLRRRLGRIPRSASDGGR